MNETPEPLRQSPVLFAENGVSWYWLLTGPGAGVAMLLLQLNAGLGLRWSVPAVFCVLVTLFVGVQIKAGRMRALATSGETVLGRTGPDIPLSPLVDPRAGLRPARARSVSVWPSSRAVAA